MYRWQERAEFRMWLLNLEDPHFTQVWDDATAVVSLLCTQYELFSVHEQSVMALGAPEHSALFVLT
jgi:hypothetical protein